LTEGWRLSLKLLSSRIPAGGSTLATVVLKNCSDRTLPYESNGFTEYNFPPEAVSAGGQAAPPTLDTEDCKTSWRGHTWGDFGGPLPPGSESQEGYLHITRVLDLSVAGEYTITCSWNVIGSDGKVKARVVSNPVLLKIVEPSATSRVGRGPVVAPVTAPAAVAPALPAGVVVHADAAEPPRGSAPPTGFPLAAGTPAGGWALSINLSSDLSYTGTPLDLQVEMKNISGHALAFERTTGQLGMRRIAVVNSKGKVMPLTSFGAKQAVNAGMVEKEKVPAGEAITDTLRLNRLYDLTIRGEYTVRLEWDVPAPDGKGTVTIISNTVPLRLVD
jgi:hypothetical protein